MLIFCICAGLIVVGRTPLAHQATLHLYSNYFSSFVNDGTYGIGLQDSTNAIAEYNRAINVLVSCVLSFFFEPKLKPNYPQNPFEVDFTSTLIKRGNNWGSGLEIVSPAVSLVYPYVYVLYGIVQSKAVLISDFRHDKSLVVPCVVSTYAGVCTWEGST